MPNHIHMIIMIDKIRCGRQGAAPTISQMVGQFKRVVSMQVGKTVWQCSFHDHIIRDEKGYNKIWEYIG